MKFAERMLYFSCVFWLPLHRVVAKLPEASSQEQTQKRLMQW